MASARLDGADRLPPGYEFVRELGVGGTGRVVLAAQPKLARLVAIKTIDGGNADPAALARLRREARVLARLAHPHIAEVFDLHTRGADVYLVMEYLPGGDLHQALDRGELSGAWAARVLAEVASALEYANAQGVVHRDVKPTNVLLDGAGRAKLADFGLARLPHDVAETPN